MPEEAEAGGMRRSPGRREPQKLEEAGPSLCGNMACLHLDLVLWLQVRERIEDPCFKPPSVS